MRTGNLNMLTDPVFPVVTASGGRRWAALSDLLAENGDFPVGFDWPRGDLSVASMELAIGLLALIYRPTRHDDWLAIWNGRSDVDVAERIGQLAPSFNLFGDAEGKGPRFCQDFEPLEGEANAIEALFIDTPGVNGQKKNTDLMTHRGRFAVLGVRAAAVALYALQQFAPSGGAGNRTSMRGGGPMTTLALLRKAEGTNAPLMRVLLASLPLSFAGVECWLEDDEVHRVLPWLRPTLTSEGDPARTVAEADPAAHPVQAFFGMPRRIRLVAAGTGLCPFSGELEPLVTGFVQKPWGTSYSVWRHPLTPYRQNKDDAPYTVKPKAGRFGYRDWVGVTIGREEKADKAFPAAAIAGLRDRTRALRQLGLETRLMAAGWAMNNMEAERFLEAVQPLYLVAEDDGARAAALGATARAHADAAESAVRLLRGAINDVLFDGQAKATNSGVFEEAADAFYERTEPAFHATLRQIAEGAAGGAAAHEVTARAWLATIRNAALRLFDEYVTDLLAERLDAGFAQRATIAHSRLLGGLSGTGKIAVDLGIPQPVGEARGHKAGKAAKEEAAS